MHAVPFFPSLALPCLARTIASSKLSNSQDVINDDEVIIRCHFLSFLILVSLKNLGLGFVWRGLASVEFFHRARGVLTNVVWHACGWDGKQDSAKIRK